MPAFLYEAPSHTVWTSESNFHFTQAKPHVPEGPRSPYLKLNSSHCLKVTLKAFGPQTAGSEEGKLEPEVLFNWTP